jgi:hypothetical protein
MLAGFAVLFLVGCCGCVVESPELLALKIALRTTGEQIVAKQDETIVILKENTTALAAIKSQVEALEAQITNPPAPKGSDPQSALAAEPVKKANDSHPASMIVAEAGSAVSLPSPVKLRWNIEGNWSPTQAETAAHLRDDHKVSTTGLNHQQMHDLHADLHEGRTAQTVAVKAKPVQILNRGSSCPGGFCPTNTRTTRRGLFGWRRR